MIESGDPTRLGATPLQGGVNFSLFSSTADRVELCLFDTGGHEHRIDLPPPHRDVWSGFVPGLTIGTQYGYRVHGRWAPDEGLWHNPAKLLIDPYAKLLSGRFQWHDAVFAYDLADAAQPSDIDSAPYVPKAVVTAPQERDRFAPRVPWQDTIIYEAGVRALTQSHPELEDSVRGKFAALGSTEIINHLKALGITSLELLPIQMFVDEQFLGPRGLANAWGYNTLAFFAPMTRYANASPIHELGQAVNALHDANIEVIMDVVYNHTAEGDGRGPTLSWRGIDNLAYYRVMPDQQRDYVNDTGTGNTLNADHPVARQMVVDSLRYWVRSFGIDGFRFDLAPILGRHFSGFDQNHPLLQQISNDPVLRHTKLIAEPWDIGPGGYRLGEFPSGWSEWNDRYRDTVRQYWRGDERQTPAMARRLHGSADIFEPSGRAPSASINFVTAHDGFTLRDLVSYEQTHNEANGENNQDGHRHNYSMNFGVEGETDDAEILNARRRQRLNLLMSVLMSQGTPMLLAGDELGRTQGGNNNAYAQDNAVTWVDWANADTEFLQQVRKLIALRQTTPLLRQISYRHGRSTNRAGQRNIEWLASNGSELHGLDWHHANAIMMLLVATENDAPPSPEHQAVALCLNPGQTGQRFEPPSVSTEGAWHCDFLTGEDFLTGGNNDTSTETGFYLTPGSMALLRWY